MAEKKDMRAVAIPAVEKVLQAGEMAPILAKYRRDVVVNTVRDVIAGLRKDVADGRKIKDTGVAWVAGKVGERLAALEMTPPVNVINATGIMIHTNLGRSILTASARKALDAAASGYCDLEVDMDTGERTRRDIRLEKIIKVLTGCEAATVVNNNAAAVFIALNTIAKGREVITSRGELIEIGGSFRVPDVVASSGAILREVGTTNRTHLRDYEAAISERTALILKTHTSNYKVIGFTQEVSLSQLVELGRKHRVPVMDDVGSGYFSPEDGGFEEPDIAQTLAEGPDIVTFSCDKLLWGPQGGILVGTKGYIDAIRKNPLWRVLRIGKLTAAALGATLVNYLKKDAWSDGDMVWMLSRRPEQLARIANRLAKQLTEIKPKWEITVLDGAGSYGGGAMPGQEIPSKIITVTPDKATTEKLDSDLRHGNPPILGYFYKGAYAINILTLLPGDDKQIVKRFQELK